MNVGILGCGYISSVYIENAACLDNINIVGCADLNNNRALEMSVRHGIACYSVTEMLNSARIDLILNLTPPKAHFESCRAALEAGKHVYVEKPISISTAHAKELLHAADQHNVRIGVAPDTFMGEPIRAAKKLIENGEIGVPIAANAFMLKPGPEKWHPNPEFFYEQGSGPMYDMGPYYITALVQLLGPVHSVSASASSVQVEREIAVGHKKGTKLTVDTPTYMSGRMDLKSGAAATIVTSFDVMNTKLPSIEIYGSKGTLIVPDPNTFVGEVAVYKEETKAWESCTYETSEFKGRGVGLADMIQAIEKKRDHEANGRLGLHVLEVIEGFHETLTSKKQYDLQTTYEIKKEQSI